MGFLNESVQLLIRLGVPKLDVNFAHKPAWTASSLRRLEKEMVRLGEYFISRYERMAEIPWPGFCGETERTIYRCHAGQNRLALSAQGTLWGCAIFPHYFAWKSQTIEGGPYCFGDVDTFIEDAGEIYPRKMLHYYGLSMDRFSTPERPCIECDEIEQCWVCPVAAAFTSGKIGAIPPWSCRMGMMLRKQKELFRDRFEKKGSSTAVARR